jgi:hypothetical protein
MACTAIAWALFVSTISMAAAAGGVKVQNVRLDAAENAAIIHIVNNSEKEISAYVISIDVTYAGGRKYYSEQLVDLLPLMMTKADESATSSLSDGAFRAGETRDEVATLPTDPRNPVVKVDAAVIAVVYSDRTVEARSEDAVERVLAVRRGIALARKEAADVISKAAADAQESDPSAAAVAEIRQMLLRSKLEHSGELRTELLSILDDLQRAHELSLPSGVSERDYLRGYAAKSSQRASTTLANTQIRREP